MFLLNFPRELRDRIYYELLCPPQGIRLQRHDAPYVPAANEDNASLGDGSAQENGRRSTDHSPVEDDHDPEWEDEDDEGEEVDDDNDPRLRYMEDIWDEYPDQEEYFEQCERRCYDEHGILRTLHTGEIRASAPISTSIFCVSRQVSSEALRVFYDSNTFVFDLDPERAIAFLQHALSPAARSQIRHLGFTTQSIHCHDIGVAAAWENWERYLKHNPNSLKIASVTLRISYDFNQGFLYGENDEREYRSSWSPATDHLKEAFLAGGFQKLRLAYFPKRFVDAKLAALYTQEDYLIRYCPVVEELRNDLPEEERNRQAEELMALPRYDSGNSEPLDLAEIAMEERWRDRREKIPFDYRQEFNDFGTVLVFTRPRDH